MDSEHLGRLRSRSRSGSPGRERPPQGRGPDSKYSKSIQRIYKYDVFISFRGTDTRNSFTDHLYNHLIRKGISTFKDDKMLEKGQPISPQLIQAIKSSRVSIIVFSKDYAASTWCLEEMATIVRCQKRFKQIVFPVFYDVDPSDVRHQRGVYTNAFVLHKAKFKQDLGMVDRWKRAMTELANSVGWNIRDKPEFGEIEKITQAVIKTLGHKFSGFVDDLIGIQPSVDELENLLKLNSRDGGFCVLGICGMGGIGKTTLATVLFDRISYQFDAHCFIDNVSKTYNDGGVVAIQKQILCQTLDEKNLEAFSPSNIFGMIKDRLHNIKVLIVLDNFDKLGRLQELAIFPQLLQDGSRIIIATRDEHILKECGANIVYQVPLLNNGDARKLFCRKAFKSDHPGSMFAKLIDEVIMCTQGLPLAIIVLGGFLFSRDVYQWRDALDRLRNNNLDHRIMNVLQISLDGLQFEEKEIFLHIACFFKGEREDYVKRILNARELYPYIGIQVLIEKSLITFRNQEIHMHDMLQKLGKKIVQDECPKDPRLWSRLWLYQDFHDVLTEKKGTNFIKAVVLDQKEDVSHYGQLKAEELSKMMGLELFILYQRNFSGCLNFLPDSMRYLLWHGYPFSSWPLNFQPNKLVELNMPYSRIQRLWEGIKNFPCLKRVDLSYSEYLTEMPSFEGIPYLERLDLTGCIKLLQVHPSIGLLEKLAFLSLRNCSNLVSLNLDSESNLHSLRVLYLSGCTKLENMPNFRVVSNLEYLDFENCTRLLTIHESIEALMKLKFLSLRGCCSLISIPWCLNTMTSLITLDLSHCLRLKNLPLGQRSELDKSIYHANIFAYVPSCCLRSLIFLDASFCNICEVPDAIDELMCLERLNLQGNNFGSLPKTIRRLIRLAYLNLSHCHELQYLPLLPYTNGSLGGRYFKTVSGSRNHRSGIYIFDCPKLVGSELSGLVLQWLRILVAQPCHFRCGFDIVIPGSVIPECFNHQFNGDSVVRIVLSHVEDDWIGFAFSVAFEKNNDQATFDSSHDSCSSIPTHPLYLSFENEDVEESFEMPLSFDKEKNVGSKHVWIIYISRPHCHFVKTGAHVTFKARKGLVIKKWGLHMVFNHNIVARNIEYENVWIRESFFNCLHFDYVHETEMKSSWQKIHLPYNWLVTEEEEIENMEAKGKENNLSIIGMGLPHLQHTPSSSRLGR